MDCFASLAMTVLQSFALWLFEKLNPISAVPKAGRLSPLPLWERSDRIVRCDPGEGLRTIDRPQPLTPTLESELRSSRSHKGQRELTAVAATLMLHVSSLGELRPHGLLAIGQMHRAIAP